MATLFRIWGCAWIAICTIAMGVFDYFLFSHRGPRVNDLLEGVVFIPGVLALLASLLISRFGERRPSHLPD
jgi:fructose-1,6-bisphosphatase/inositol monophosphatase family enzyme